MTERVRSETFGSVCRVEMNAGRDMFLSRPLCFELTRALNAAQNDGQVKVILLTGTGDYFSKGYDLSSLSSDADRTALFDLVDTLVDFKKPTIAALQGHAFGAGLELAMLCAFRLAAPGVQIGLPDIALGLPPGAGATQTLPRVMGTEACLRLLLKGQLAKASALGAGLDAEINGDFQAGALRFAQALAEQDLRGFSMANRNEGFADPAAYQSALFAARQNTDPKDDARVDILNAMESALLLPFTAGIEFEREAFKAAEARPDSKARRHLAQQADRLENMQSSRLSGLPDIERIAVIGRSDLSFSIAASLLLGGINVTLVHDTDLGSDDLRFDVLDCARAIAQAQGLAELHEASLSDRLSLSTELEASAIADVVLDATGDGPDSLGVRCETMGESLPGHVVYVVASQELGLEGLAQRFGRETQFAKIWLGSSTDQGAGENCVEISAVSSEDSTALDAGLKVAQLLQSRAVCVLGEAGAVTLSMAVSLLNAAEELVLAGTPVSAVDLAMTELGLQSGPFQWADTFGIAHLVAQNRELPLAFRQALPISTALAKVGTNSVSVATYYTDEPGRTGLPNPDATRAIQDLRDGRGEKADREHIQQRCLAAIANTASQLIAGGIVAKPGDIDLLAQAHLGFETRSGGPLHCADRVGLLHLRYLLSDEDGPNAAHASLLDMIKNGQNFNALNSQDTVG